MSGGNAMKPFLGVAGDEEYWEGSSALAGGADAMCDAQAQALVFQAPRGKRHKDGADD